MPTSDAPVEKRRHTHKASLMKQAEAAVCPRPCLQFSTTRHTALKASNQHTSHSAQGNAVGGGSPLTVRSADLRLWSRVRVPASPTYKGQNSLPPPYWDSFCCSAPLHEPTLLYTTYTTLHYTALQHNLRSYLSLVGQFLSISLVKNIWNPIA